MTKPPVAFPQALPAPPPSSPQRDGLEQALTLRSAEFRKGREQAWVRLDHLVSRMEKKGPAALSAAEARELPLLYREVMASLSMARGIVLDRNLLLYLEDLSLRAYLAVYGPRSGVLQNLGAFARRGFPRAVRGIRWHLLIVLVALLAGTGAGYWLVMADMSYFNMLVPDSLAGGRGPGSTAQDLMREELFAPWPGFMDSFIVFANFLFRHNTMVGILSFGLGFALGLPTLMLMAYQGLILGAFIALHADKGLAIPFLGWISIHGVTEILAILLCGAAGLVTAEKMLFPGPLPRLESLALAGRKAASVAAGAVGLFFLAGLLEGGFRQLISNTPGRFAFAAATAALWLYYFALQGREARHGSAK